MFNWKRRGGSRLHSPLLLLAAAVVALAVIFVHDERPAAADHGSDYVLWTATMKLPSASGLGCAPDIPGRHCDQLLHGDSDQHFGKNLVHYFGHHYRVTVIENGNRDFILGFDRAVPADLIANATLYVDGRRFRLADFSPAPDFRHALEIRPSPNLQNWASGQSVEFELRWTPPYTPGRAPSASDASVVWSARLTGDFCDTLQKRIDPQRNQGMGGIVTTQARRSCTDTSYLTSDSFTRRGQEVKLLDVWPGYVIDNRDVIKGTVASAQEGERPPVISIAFNRRLTEVFSSAEHHAKLPRAPFDSQIRSRLFVWFGNQPLALRDAAAVEDAGHYNDLTTPWHEFAWHPNYGLPHPSSTQMRLALAPAAPTGLASSAGNRRLTVSWTASPGPVTGYDVHYKTVDAPDREWTRNSNPANGWVDARHRGTSTSRVIGGLADGTTYDVRVRARNNGGWSDWARPGVWHSHMKVLDISRGRVVGCRSEFFAENAGVASGKPRYTSPRNAAFCNDHWVGADPYRGGIALFEGAFSDEDFDYNGVTYRVVGLESSRAAANAPYKALLTLDRDISAVVASLSLSTRATKPVHSSVPVSNHFRVADGAVAPGGNIHGFSDATNTAVTPAEDLAPVNAPAHERWVPGDIVEAWLWDTSGWTTQACTNCGTLGPDGRVELPAQDAPQEVETDQYAALIANIYEWRNDPRYVSDKRHTDRWDRVLLTFGETVSDPSLTEMTADEAQTYVDRGWSRWVEVAEALGELEAAAQAESPTTQVPPASSNRAPVISAVGDVTIVDESGTQSITSTSMFEDPDYDDMTVSGTSSDTSVATVSASANGSVLTISAKSRGTATITATADDGNGGTATNSFTVRVKAAPAVATTIGDISGLEAGDSRLVSLSGVFSDADGDALSVTAAAGDENVAVAEMSSDGASLTVTGVSAGDTDVAVVAEDTDGNQAIASFAVSVAASQPVVLVPPQDEGEQPQEPDPSPTPEPDPSPTPEPETQAPVPEVSDVVARYDTNGDGKISGAEMGDAINDYIAGKITYEQVVEVNIAFQSS